MSTENTTDEAALHPVPGSALRWTRNRPKTPGWYWLAAPVGYTPRIVRVWSDSSEMIVQSGNGSCWPLIKRGGWKGCKWAGPILPPKQNWTNAKAEP